MIRTTPISDRNPTPAGAAFLAAQGPRHLCGSCHTRKRRAGDWLCRQCRLDLREDMRSIRAWIAGEPFDRGEQPAPKPAPVQPATPLCVTQYAIVHWTPDRISLIRFVDERRVA